MDNIIIKNKVGKILKKPETLFGSFTLECKNGHQFLLTSSRLTNGEWCSKCDPVENELINIGVKYENDNDYKFIVPELNLYILYKYEKEKVEKIVEKGKKILIIESFSEDLRHQLIEKFKSSNSITYIKNNQFSIVEQLSEKEDDTGSEIKHTTDNPPEYKEIAFGYVRVSTTMQVQDGFSLESQEHKIIEECKKRDLFLKSIYLDKGISGGSMKKRLSLERILKDLKHNSWIIVNSVSRLARNTKDLLGIVEEIESKKCHLIIMDLNLDITSPSGKLILTLMGSQAQFERELTSERVKTVMGHLKEMGQLRTKPPFGYMMNPDKRGTSMIHVKNEKDQETLKQLRYWRNKYPFNDITSFSRILNERKVPPPRKSKQWYHGALKTIMTREGIK